MSYFKNYQYHCWQSDLLRTNTNFFKDLASAFQSEKTFQADSKVGQGITINENVIPTFSDFDNVKQMFEKQLLNHYDNFNINIFNKKKKLKFIKCWANRIFEGTQGGIHSHGNTTVFLLYLKTPINSSRLIFIDPVHTDKIGKLHDNVPETDKLYLDVTEGMCVVHDGRMLHAVSKHGNIEPREVLVFEFSSIFI